MAALAGLLALLESSKYVLLFAGSYIEGTVVMMTGGLLWRLGTVDFLPAFTALVLGDILADIMWYTIGYFGARRFVDRWGHFFGITQEIVEKIERRFHKYHLRILIISKLTMGFGLAVPVLVSAGMMRISFVRFVIINFLGGLVWVLAMMSVGYYFGNVIDLIPNQYRIAAAIAVVIGFFFGVKLLTSRLAKSDW
jgi:membrane protein DedA with SNARE-associated domain